MGEEILFQPPLFLCLHFLNPSLGLGVNGSGEIWGPVLGNRRQQQRSTADFMGVILLAAPSATFFAICFRW